MKDGLGHQSILYDLRNVTQDQLNTYPVISFKRNIKLKVKTLLKREISINNDQFFWPNALLATSLEWTHRLTGDESDLDSLKKYYDKWLKKGLPIKNADYALNGYSLIYLYKITKNKKYLEASRKIIGYLYAHTKSNAGSLPYREKSPNTILIDSLGMVCPFLCRYGDLMNEENPINLAINQLTNFLKYGMDDNTNLPYHGYNSSNFIKLGIVGWGRGTGWLLIGLIDSLEYIPTSHPKYQYLCKQFRAIVSMVIKYQNHKGEFTWQISANDSFTDSSSTSMINYAISRGIMLGIIPESYFKNTEIAVSSLHELTRDGVVEACSAECKGIGMYPQKYGQYPWAQGPTTALIAISIYQKKLLDSNK